MTNQLVAVEAINKRTNEKVFFLVVAESVDRAGWPLLEKYKSFDEKYAPVSFRPMCSAPDRNPQVIDAFGPSGSIP